MRSAATQLALSAIAVVRSHVQRSAVCSYFLLSESLKQWIHFSFQQLSDEHLLYSTWPVKTMQPPKKRITTLAKAIVLLGIVGITIVVPYAGVVTIPVGFLAGLWLFWRT